MSKGSSFTYGQSPMNNYFTHFHRKKRKLLNDQKKHLCFVMNINTKPDTWDGDVDFLLGK